MTWCPSLNSHLKAQMILNISGILEHKLAGVVTTFSSKTANNAHTEIVVVRFQI